MVAPECEIDTYGCLEFEVVPDCEFCRAACNELVSVIFCSRKAEVSQRVFHLVVDSIIGNGIVSACTSLFYKVFELLLGISCPVSFYCCIVSIDRLDWRHSHRRAKRRSILRVAFDTS